MQKKSEISSSIDKTAILLHISGILTFIAGPLIVKKMSKDPKIISHATKALNWQINVILYIITGIILSVVTVGYFIIPLVLVANIAFSVIAAIKASNNELWDYPFSFLFLE